MNGLPRIALLAGIVELAGTERKLACKISEWINIRLERAGDNLAKVVRGNSTGARFSHTVCTSVPRGAGPAAREKRDRDLVTARIWGCSKTVSGSQHRKLIWSNGPGNWGYCNRNEASDRRHRMI